MKSAIFLVIIWMVTIYSGKAATTPGLAFRYYEGMWSNLPDFNTITPVKAGSTSNVNINIRNSDSNYAVLWQGYITIPVSGIYTFETNSDDGSKLYIGTYSYSATALVNNDGTHTAASRQTGSVFLNAGTYPIAVSYFQAGTNNVMEVYWSSTMGIIKQKIPDGAFTQDIPNSNETTGLLGSVNYYFSTIDGDDSRTATQAQNPFTPWKTLAKLNAVASSAKTGTAFLLKRGDVFDGTITISSSGTANNPIILSAYGIGDKPVVNGLTSLTNWTNVNGNIWQASVKAGQRLNMLTVNNTPQSRGRYPNRNTSNEGYRTYTAHNGFNSITDPALPNTTNWTGAELSVRSVRWMLNTYKITSQNAGVINYAGSPDTMIVEPINGFGYFIQNDPRTLDQQGEWYYNPASQYVQLYSTVNPSTLNVKAATADTLLRGNSITYLCINNISFQGSNRYTLFFYAGNHITITNCTLNYAGYNAIKADQTTEVVFRQNIISNSNNNGLEVFPFCYNSLIEYNTVVNSGTIEGMGANGNYANCAIIANGSGSIVRYNNVIKAGYNGIVMSGSHIDLRHNYVDTFCYKFDDGAGLYTSGPGTDRSITGNIVLHGIGNTHGTNADSSDGLANAIGLDDNSEYVVIDSNSAAFCSREGVGIHNTHNVLITNNTLYAIGQRALGWANDINAPDNPIRNVTVKKNIFFSNSSLPVKSSEGPIANANALAQFDTRKENYDELTKFGVSDSNYWMKPFYLNSNDFFRTCYRPIPAGTTVGPSQEDSNIYRKYVTLDFAHWQSAFNQDAHSVSGLLYPPYTVTSENTSTYSNGTFDTNINYVLNPHASSTDPNNNYITQSWNNSHLDGGSLQVAYTGAGSSNGKFAEAWFYDNVHAQTFLAGHTYRAKFSIMGSTDGNADFRCVLRSGSIGESRWMYFKVYNTRSEVEFLFTPSQDIPSAFLAVINDDASLCPVWWFDNLSLQEVNVTYHNPDEYIRFEFNATQISKVVLLDGIYTDVKNNTYNFVVTLDPYTSVILLKKSAGLNILHTTSQANILMDNSDILPGSSAGKTMRIIPNPAINQIQISLPVAKSGQQIRLTISNSTGNTVKIMQVNTANQPLNINVSGLLPGTYIVNANYGSSAFTSRFIKL